MSTPLHVAPLDISKVDRFDVAMRAYTVAAARLRALELEAEHAFREYHDARERLDTEHGVICDVELKAGVAAAYSVYKQDLAKSEGREIARADA